MTLAMPKGMPPLGGMRRDFPTSVHDTNQHGLHTARSAQIDRCRNGKPGTLPAARSIRQAGFDIGAGR